MFVSLDVIALEMEGIFKIVSLIFTSSFKKCKFLPGGRIPLPYASCSIISLLESRLYVLMKWYMYHRSITKLYAHVMCPHMVSHAFCVCIFNLLVQNYNIHSLNTSNFVGYSHITLQSSFPLGNFPWLHTQGWVPCYIPYTSRNNTYHNYNELTL